MTPSKNFELWVPVVVVVLYSLVSYATSFAQRLHIAQERTC